MFKRLGFKGLGLRVEGLWLRFSHIHGSLPKLESLCLVQVCQTCACQIINNTPKGPIFSVFRDIQDITSIGGILPQKWKVKWTRKWKMKWKLGLCRGLRNSTSFTTAHTGASTKPGIVR